VVNILELVDGLDVGQLQILVDVKIDKSVLFGLQVPFKAQKLIF
jgi:hypothetical protein